MHGLGAGWTLGIHANVSFNAFVRGTIMGRSAFARKDRGDGTHLSWGFLSLGRKNTRRDRLFRISVYVLLDVWDHHLPKR